MDWLKTYVIWKTIIEWAIPVILLLAVGVFWFAIWVEAEAKERRNAREQKEKAKKADGKDTTLL